MLLQQSIKEIDVLQHFSRNSEMLKQGELLIKVLKVLQQFSKGDICLISKRFIRS